MTHEKETGRCQATRESTCSADYSRPPKKWKRVLSAFLTGKSFNRFEAERELADHVLPSTVAGLQSKGLTIFRHDERVPGFQNIATICSRYRLAPESYQKARELLQMGPSSNDHAERIGEHHLAPDHAQEARHDEP